MKKYEDFSEYNAFFDEKKEISEFLSDNSLVESELRYEDVGAERKRGFLPLAAMMVAVALAVACMLIFLALARKEDAPALEEPAETEEEWRGAFFDREIYECSLDASVNLEVGEYGTEKSWSGFLVSENGWIATSGRKMDSLRKGRICATLSDGREYWVEKIFRIGDVALLKISIEKAASATLEDVMLQGGERIISVNAAGDILSGEISSPESLRINISLTEEWEGAPIYDARGKLVGMVNSNENREVYCLPSAEISEALAEKNKNK